MKNVWIVVIIFLIIIVVGCILYPPFGVFMILLLIAGLIIGLKDKRANDIKEVQADIKLLGEHAIHITKRCERNRKVLSISRFYHTNYEYHPASATYTGATVGGVTTGGWTFNEANYTATSGAMTNKYQLWYKIVEGKKTPIFVVKLEPADAKAAANDPKVGKYLDGECIYLSPKETSKKDNMSSTEKAGEMGYASGLLTKEELLPILDFLCTGAQSEVEKPKEKSFVCQACGKTFTGWYQECPSCHAVGKMKKRL